MTKLDNYGPWALITGASESNRRPCAITSLNGPSAAVPRPNARD